MRGRGNPPLFVSVAPSSIGQQLIVKSDTTDVLSFGSMKPTTYQIKELTDALSDRKSVSVAGPALWVQR